MEQDKNMYPVVKVDGFVEKGKQFDLDITIPEDNRNVVYGVIRDCYKEPVADAVVKLIEVDLDHGTKIRKPVSHTFTDKDGEFVFGPLCPDKNYEVQIWVDQVKHVKICAECGRHGKCLKGVKLDCRRPHFDDKYDDKYDDDKCDMCDKHDDYKDDYKKDDNKHDDIFEKDCK